MKKKKIFNKYLGKGSVIRYMKDGSTVIYYSNGNVTYAKPRSNIWTTTNNKGLRK